MSSWKLAAVIDEGTPVRVFLQGSGIAYHDEEVFSSGDGYVHPSFIHEESEGAFDLGTRIGSYTVDYDNLFLSSLVGIDSIDLNIIQPRILSMKCSEPRPQCIFQYSYLRLVWSNES